MEMSLHFKMFLTILLVMIATSLVGLIGSMSDKEKVYIGAVIALLIEMFVTIGYLIYSIWR